MCKECLNKCQPVLAVLNLYGHISLPVCQQKFLSFHGLLDKFISSWRAQQEKTGPEVFIFFKKRVVLQALHLCSCEAIQFVHNIGINCFSNCGDIKIFWALPQLVELMVCMN
mmetsp:Transcript_54856/g.126014  ORF Transcript_54856/g.126014 Transcript_54856/m.126014 type:complete len:112 (+) Transcript_54856:34-369(+)